ncbi:hypothetical protein [Fulvivirga kasyanovii]|uniref:hypothetical protein n=1 Tax=Fulvivirga kasyanovii TaxID=396812 RepID=UPI0031E18C5C
MKRNKFCSYLLQALMVIALGACVEPTLSNNVDLLETIYLDKGISFVTLKDTINNEIYDSIFIDNNRRIVRTVGAMTNEQIEYNSLGYKTRILERADKPFNILINYQIIGDTLYQKWIPIKHYNWDYNDNDLDITKSFVIKLKLNHAKKPILEIDDKRDIIKKYYYDNENLSRIEIIDIETNQKLENRLFQYQGNVLVKTETHDLGGKTEILFNEGLPCLFRRINKDYSYTLNYQYYY